MTKKFVYLCGRSGAGKDTCADYIIKLAEKNGKKAIKYSLGDPLKIMLKEFIFAFKGVDIDIEEFYNSYDKERDRIDMGVINNINDRTSEAKPFSLRRSMQTVGTDILENKMDKYMFIKLVHNYFKEKYDEYDIFILADGRKPEQLEYFKRKNKYYEVQSIKIFRDEYLKNDTAEHLSEKIFAEIVTDHIIYNYDDIETFYANIEAVIKF
jgi:adenylate kinase family enzyme